MNQTQTPETITYRIDPYLAEVWKVPTEITVPVGTHEPHPLGTWSSEHARWISNRCLCGEKFYHAGAPSGEMLAAHLEKHDPC